MTDDLDHTADVRLKSQAATLPGLFERCALDLDTYIFGSPDKGAPDTATETIRIQSVDLESLLVDWLSECLYLFHVRYVRCINVAIQDFRHFELVATVMTKHAVALRDVKAVTYSELAIERCEEGWKAIVTYDL